MAGGNPTFASCWTQLGYAFKLLNEARKFGSANSANVLDMVDAIRTGYDGEYIPSVDNLVLGIRSSFAGPLEPSAIRAVAVPYLREMCRVIDAPESTGTDPVRMLFRIRQYMLDNAEYLKSRSLTLNTPALGSPATGTGVIYRCTTDKDGNTLECTGTEAKRAECVQDQSSGAREHAEVFEFRGDPRERDWLQFDGTGFLQNVPAVHAGVGLLRNGSFDVNGASADDTALSATTSASGWVVATAANWKARSNASYVYRDYPGAPSTSWGLEMIASDSITQTFNSASPGLAFRTDVPYLALARWKRLSSATGTLTLTFGGTTTTATVGSATNGDWNTIYLVKWYDQLALQDATFKLDVATLAAGTVAFDDCGVWPMVPVDGTFYLPVGSSTPFLRGDFFTWTDTGTIGAGILNEFLWRMFLDSPADLLRIGGWFPATTGSAITIADPT